ncbi:MAG: Chromosomal replication initiator protein DnaA [Candidatus Dependentiae bacterium ADurb.Bin331]|nr:MAG: Chromosomal replication initiator protein DnaA [Candidatus Dependentiae bacterium ADurb.Bin331]
MLTTIWEQFLLIAREEAGSRVVETWLKAVTLTKWDSLHKTIHIKAPNTFVKEWIKSNYLTIFHHHLSRLLNVDQLKIVFAQDGETIQPMHHALDAIKIMPAQLIVPPEQQKKNAKLVKTAVTPFRHQLNKNFVFDTFIVGPNNHMAYAAAYAITQKLGKLYNPLFIYGGSGLGKTHLLHAIAHEIKNNYKDVDVLYQPADRFVNEFIHAIRFDKIHQFQAKYKEIDLLLIDDVQCISNKEQTQEAFFHIFNSLYDAHKQIVFSSDSYPANIHGVAERLRSRMASGLVVDVQIPAIETKIAILKRKAEFQHEELPDEVAAFIASTVNSNIRELEGAFIRVNAFAQLTKQPISLELAKKVLTHNGKNTVERHTIDFERIVKAIGSHYSYTLTDLRSKKRSKELSWARQLAMYFMRKLTDKSLHEIALYLGRSDHSTVIHAFRQVQDRAEADHAFHDQINRMKEEILY